MKKGNKIALAVLSVLLLCALVVSGIFVLKNYQQTTEVAGDISWYDESGEEFTITTVEQFYGLAELSKSYDFKGQTIKLGADIVVNEGDAEDWVETAPERRWIPITGFAGKFDGQGHTISGIYGDSIITSLGLFTDTQKGCVIKDLKLVNSCFKNNNDKGSGSIIGFGGGKLENIYSDAVISSAGKYVGGLIGRVTAKGENQITNCWFDGVITMKSADTSEVGGLVGAFTVEDALNAVQHCLSTADITCHGVNVGGICGNVGSGSFLNLIDSMYTGTLDYNTDKYDKVGSVIGQITGGSTAIIKDTYTVDEIANRTIGTNGGYQEGSAIAVDAADLIGIGGYQWTTLDFDTYWAAQTEETPILAHFAEKSVSVANVDRLVDISWYNPTGKTFIIKSAEEFYGFAYLSRSYDFSGQIIKLGADITINEGNAEDWQEEAPQYKWTPIAWHGTSLSKRFKGEFDGQGHTISGIYCKGDESDGYIGLFGEIYHGSVVKNFRIVNSYFEGVMPSNVRGTVGTVCGRLRGTIDSVYSSAIIVNSAKMTGGIAGMINGTGQNTISNCWFDGKVTGSSRTGGILGGVYGNKASIEATIEHCLNTGEIAVQLGKGDVGGICGMAETWCTLYIKDCLNTGTFKTVGTGKKANTHIGTIFGSVTQTNDVGSRVEISNSFGTKDFYSKLVGWKFGKEGISQSSVSFVSADEVKGYGGYQWTTLDFKDSWAVRTTDVPIPVVFATSRPSLNGVTRLVDYSWYDADKDVYTIKNFQQLYAAARLWDVTNQFKGKTIKLGADITFNKGNAADWAEKAPTLVWEPMRFNGTFDGQGHKISGIYVKGGEEDNYVGFFYRIYKNGTVKNVRLVNSYIEGTMPSNKRGAVGSIAGRSNGIIDTVYSDAIVVNSARMTGGIVGMITGEGQNKISNTWFDGSVTGVSRTGGILGGVYGNKENIQVHMAHCLNTGDIAVQIGYGDVGGLCGMVETGGTLNLTDSLNAGTFATIGEGKEPNTHIGTLVGSVTKTDEVKSKVTMKHVYGVEEFYSKLVGWSYADNAVSKSSVSMTDMAKLNGNGGYQWTTLDFGKYWAVRTNDVPALLSFVSGANVAGIERMLSWYDENSDEYTITTKEQLMGFNFLCDAEHDYFAGKTIKLGADITLNTGDAADWAENTPTNVWIPTNFKGTFDGQGHTISGVYVKSDTTYTGFFTTILGGATVKNLNLVNSYIEGTNTSGRCGTGSIAGRNSGTIDTIYSNAIVKNGALMTGGIAGMTTTNDENLITNCWFGGQIYANGSTGGILGGTYKSTATITHCLNTGTLNINAGSTAVGGVCGYAQSTSNVVVTDSLNAGKYVQVGEGTVKQVGTILGALHADAVLDADHVYGVKEFSEKKFGYDGGGADLTFTLVRNLEAIKGYGAYQWLTLDFEDTDGAGEDKAYWVLKDGEVPVPAVFDTTDLSLEQAKKLSDYTWYDADKKEYIFTTKEESISFSEICTEELTDCFAGKTVKLGSSITFNSGDANDWMETPPAIKWEPQDFSGIFDGQGYTLSGLYVKTSNTVQYTGLFKTLNKGAVVKNLTIDNSYFEGTNDSVTRAGVGSVAGRNNGTIEAVKSNAILKNSKQMTGGIAGMVTGNGENTITNCWFSGQIYSVGSTGGILGGSYAADATVKHCLNTGTLNITSGSAIGGIYGYAQSTGDVVLEDNLNAGTYVKVGSGTVKQVGTIIGAVHANATLELTDTYGVNEFASNIVGWPTGTVARITRNSSAGRPLADIKGYGAYQWLTLDFEDTDGDGEDKAYWVLRDGEIPALDVFADANLNLSEAKKLVNYSWYAADSDEYIISTAKELYGFNECCNETHDYFAGKTIKLDADIALNTLGENEKVSDWRTTAPANEWAPVDFKGTFDGQGHTLSGVYVNTTDDSEVVAIGLFGTVQSGATVKNLKITDSYFIGKGKNNRSSVGSIAGNNNGTVDTIYSNAIVENTKQATGGIVGKSEGTGENCVRNCWFDGTIYVNAGNNKTASVGGVQGCVYKTTGLIEHCLNTGVLNITSGTGVGGILGNAQDASDVTMKDCLNAGEYHKGTGTVKQVGSIVGPIGNKATLTVSNAYGITEFSTEVYGWLGSGKLIQVENTAFEVKSKEDCYSDDLNLTFYASSDDLTNTNPRTFWWISRDGKIPMLADFKALANTLGK